MPTESASTPLKKPHLRRSNRDPLQRTIRGLPATVRSEVIFRLAIDSSVDALEPLGFVLKPRFGKLPSEVQLSRLIVERLISEPFRRKNFPAQRWNPLEFRCFYSALERETAVDEVAYYVRKRLLTSAEIPHAYYVQLAIQFQGKIVDIHNLIPSFPELVGEAYHPNCHRVAMTAFRRGIDALLAPSVRRPGGKCLAVYKKRALKVGDIVEEVEFQREKDGQISVQRRPYARQL